MKSVLFTLTLLSVSVTIVPAFAHHSFAATYFEDKTVTIQGKVVQFMFRNPHSYIHLEAKDDSGKMQEWPIEWGDAGQLNREGVNRDTLRPGDIVKVTGNPGRQPEEHRIRLRSIQRSSDGFKWSGTIQ